MSSCTLRFVSLFSASKLFICGEFLHNAAEFLEKDILIHKSLQANILQKAKASKIVSCDTCDEILDIYRDYVSSGVA